MISKGLSSCFTYLFLVQKIFLYLFVFLVLHSSFKRFDIYFLYIKSKAALGLINARYGISPFSVAFLLGLLYLRYHWFVCLLVILVYILFRTAYRSMVIRYIVYFCESQDQIIFPILVYSFSRPWFFTNFEKPYFTFYLFIFSGSVWSSPYLFYSKHLWIRTFI